MTGALLELAAVERRYRGGAGVGPIDLSIGAGEVLALMGPNGSGKSTLLRVLATADRADRGRVAWWCSPDRRAARRRIGYAPDEVVEEVSLSPRQSTYFWCRQWLGDAMESRRRTEAALRGAGVAAVADEPLANLSFGTRRRVGLAQALVHDPDLVLLDEPTAGVDPGGVDDLIGLLARRRDAGASGVIASNDPSFVERIADRVAFLDRGRLLRCASTAELLAELPRRRVAELRLREGSRGAVEVDGARRLGSSDGWERYELAGDGVLPALVSAADSPGGRLAGLRLRQPDLRECFRSLTGRDIESPP